MKEEFKPVTDSELVEFLERLKVTRGQPYHEKQLALVRDEARRWKQRALDLERKLGEIKDTLTHLNDL